MNKIIGWFWRIALVLVLFVAYQVARDWWWRDSAPRAEKVSVEIPAGSGVSEIASLLEENGVIRHPKSFAFYVMMHGLSRDLHAGTFSLPPYEDFETLTGLLQDSDAIDVSITIPEGYTVAQIGDVLNEQLGIGQEEWRALTEGKEGYLFPDTYRFVPSATAQNVFDKMSENFALRMQKEGLSPTREQIIIASILEREVRRPEEMVKVSDIIRKRLAIGMALQMDSTVNYVTEGGRASATYEDISVDSPYNTYKYPGLPPGPISNPGMSAIRAAMNPEANPYYYFLTDPEGRVYYAETFDQHVANRRYLR